jgi:hypothetical protein
VIFSASCFFTVPGKHVFTIPLLPSAFVPQKLESWVWLLAPRNAHGVRGENHQKDFLKPQKLYSKG